MAVYITLTFKEIQHSKECESYLESHMENFGIQGWFHDLHRPEHGVLAYKVKNKLLADEIRKSITLTEAQVSVSTPTSDQRKREKEKQRAYKILSDWSVSCANACDDYKKFRRHHQLVAWHLKQNGIRGRAVREFLTSVADYALCSSLYVRNESMACVRDNNDLQAGISNESEEIDEALLSQHDKAALERMTVPKDLRWLLESEHLYPFWGQGFA